MNSIRKAFWSVVLLAVVRSAFCQGSELPPDQSARLQQLLENQDLSAFTNEANDFWSLRVGWDDVTKNNVRNAVSNKARELLLSIQDFRAVQLTTTESLAAWALSRLSPEENAEIRRRIDAAFPASNDLGIEDLQSRVALESALSPNRFEYKRATRSFVAAWVRDKSLNEMTKAQLHWCYTHLCPEISDEDGFQATWTGFLSVPQSGDYVLSVSPWNISFEHHEFGIYRQWMNVRLANERVVDAKPDRWNFASAPVPLDAGQKIPIRVEFRFERNNQRRLCPVILYWTGPGISRSVIPASAFSIDQAGAQGLQAEYTWNADESDNIRPLVERVIDPNIEFIWPSGTVIGAREEAPKKVADEFARRWQSPEGGFITDITKKPRMVSLLTCSQLATCLRAAAQHPDQFREIDEWSNWGIQQFYTATRCGAESEALQVLGEWMTRHKDDIPSPAANAAEYFNSNRKLYYNLAVYLGFENPPLAETFERDFLELADGSCCLPVAYTLAERYILQTHLYYPNRGRIDEWIAQLDDRLADESLTGDRRVNWLIARAQAQEIHLGRGDRFAWNLPDFWLGRQWLDEALLVAESDAARNRVKFELIARLIAEGSIERAREELNAIASNTSDQQIVARIRDWRNEIQEFESRAAQRRIDDAKQAEDFHRQRLEAQRDEAAQRGDSQAIAIFEQQLSELPSE
jgi:hypothetical protein